MNELFQPLMTAVQPLQDSAPLSTPFMLAAATAPQRLDRNKLVESAITALVSGGLIAAAGYLVALPVLEEKIKTVIVQVVEVKLDVKEVKAKVEVVAERQQRLEGRLEGERRPGGNQTKQDRQ